MTMKEAPRDDVACEQTVLHHAGAIQKGAGLVLLDRATMALQAVNATMYQDYDAPQTLEDIIPADEIAAMKREIAENKFGEARFMRLQKGEYVWAGFFDAEDRIGIDITYIEEAMLLDDDTNHLFAKCVQSLSSEHELALQSSSNDLKGYFDTLVAGLQSLCGFDRVMMYKFDPDLNGEVISESLLSPDVPAYFGLKFPSGDIPKPARDLFLLNKVRQVIEVEASPEPIISTVDGHTMVPFDQSHSAFRYTSPIHLDYLTNMGVTATLTIGIVVQRKLWGLLSCHHMSGRLQVPPHRLTLCHVLSDLASNHVARLIERQRTRASSDTRSLLSHVARDVYRAETPDEFSDVVAAFGPRFLALLNADGMQFESETANWILGDLPGSKTVSVLDKAAKVWQACHDRSYVATADLHRFHPNLPNDARPFGGMLHFASWDSKTRLKVFRKAGEKSKTWAGDPNIKTNKTVVPKGAMHPRNSFAAYQEITSGSSDVWEESELQVGRDLQAGLRNIEMTFHKTLRERQLRQSNAEMQNALISANHQAHHDQLTGVANRRGFERHLADLVPRSRRTNIMWLCHLDVDHFKKINDTLGHIAGDAVLQHVAGLLKRTTEGLGFISRVGGDEFTIILSGEQSRSDVEAICNMINKGLREPLFHEGVEVTVSCTFGITSFEAGADDSSNILARSDLALYAGKAKGRGVFEFFSPEMEDESKIRRQIEKEIEDALEYSEFTPYFQPQIDVKTQEVVGFEVLARWQHPNKGILKPHCFIDVAEDMGVLGDIDREMLKKAIDVQSDWQKNCGRMTPISVNVSLDRLRCKTLLDDLTKLGSRAKSVTLELLEAIDLDEHDVDFVEVLKNLRGTGVGIEIDDFGAGRTSILAVLKVQPDRLKIDKRLIDPIVQNKSARNIVRSVIGIGQQLGIEALAEGVETAAQVGILSDLECERIQGYYYGKPQSAAEISGSPLVAA